jgi:hypothetical protein
VPSSQPVWVSFGSSATRARPKSIRIGVGRLHVAVEYADLVHAGQPVGQAPGEPPEVLGRDRALLGDVVVQAQPGHVAGGDERDVGPRVGVDDLGDPPAADPAQ